MLTRRQSLIWLPAMGLVGCGSVKMDSVDMKGMAGAAKDAGSALTLSDAEVSGYASQMAKQMDSEARVAPADNAYSKRLMALTSNAKEEKGLRLNYKVYITKEVNAFAMADGTIRIYSGLMDMLTDDEIRYVVGHEIGHVFAGHSKKRSQAALATSAAQKTAASSGNATASTLASSQLGDLIVKVVKAQHSQSNENEADDFAMEFMSSHKYDRKAVVTALEKLDKLSGGADASWLSTHPAPKERAARMRPKAA
jgi:metalloprotease